MNIKVLGFLAAILSVGRQSSCDCPINHPQTSICVSQVAIRCIITSPKLTSPERDLWGNLVYFKVRQLVIIKGVNLIQEVQEVYTGSRLSCGYNPGDYFQNREFLLFGKVHNKNSIFLYRCSFLKLWKELTWFQQTSIMGNYQSGCNCEISLCMKGMCFNRTVPHECQFTDDVVPWTGPGKDPYFRPQYEGMVCRRQSNGSCGWDSRITPVRSFEWR
ncbi:metalloproteinase inhibitor 2-like [Callorhinchus milii]|uniref:Metalloproteinase inhibitor 4-like protein n=1 Tax=Callorhinchus milii TaxID=7868 RepID=V9L998_CALMI|nr:metalloproteinase inhibitor 2-like [Callorhinchus milii]